MKKLFLILLFPFLSPGTILAQHQPYFDWYEGSCLINGIIDSTKATYDQVQNVYYTAILYSDMSQPYLAYRIKDTASLKIKNIRFECTNFQNELSKMEYPEGDYWVGLKKARMDYLKEQCLLREKAIIALTQPKALKGTPYCKECSRYVTALEKGGKTLTDTWKEIHEKEVAEALDPSPIIQSFEKNWNSPDREFLARIEVLRYGWWNCILENQKTWVNEGKCTTEFKKLMRSFKSDCH